MNTQAIGQAADANSSQPHQSGGSIGDTECVAVIAVLSATERPDENAPAPDAPIRVVVADDHTLLRHGIRALLAEAGGFEVVAEAGDGRQAVWQASQQRPDVVLLDVEMPGLSALETLRQLRKVGTSRVLLLGAETNEERLFAWLRAGAAGFLLKEATGAELVCAVREVKRAGFYLSSTISRKVLNRWHQGAARQRSGSSGAGETRALSARERELLAWVGWGLSNREIAQRLCISVKTVEAHKAHIVAKLGLKGAADLIRYAAQTHLVPGGDLTADD